MKGPQAQVAPKKMLLWLTLIFFWSNVNCTEYDAANAIQHAIFGDDSGTIPEPLPEQRVINAQSAPVADADDADAAVAAEQATASADQTASNSASHHHTTHAQTAAHYMMASSRAYGIAHGAPGSHGGASGALYYSSGYRGGSGRNFGSRRRRSSYGHGSSRRRTSYMNTAQRAAEQPTVTPFRQGQLWSGKSYSFAELSHMDVKAAPSQQGTFYKPREYESIPVVQPCQAVQCHLSIAIMMDSSGSVGADNYRKELGFVKTLLQILTIKASDSNLKVCTGIISYSSDVHVEVDPCCENSMCRVIDQFNMRNKMVYRDGSTNTNGALKVARQMLQAPASYKRVALLITDGKSNTGGSPVSFAKKMREQDGISIVALGVTNDINELELRGISGIDVVTKIDQFDDFHELANLLLQANKIASNQNIDYMCFRDKSAYKDTCERVITEEQKMLCVWGEWSTCTRKDGKCVETKTCKHNGLVIIEETGDCDCPPCPAGQEESAGTLTCVDCSPNTYKPEGELVCRECPEGTLSDGGAPQCYKDFDVVDEYGTSVEGAGEGLLLYKGGTVCDDYFSAHAAQALCRKMGRPYSQASFRNDGSFSWALQNKMEIKMDDVKCVDDDWSTCSFIEYHNCSHSEDVIIDCQGDETPTPTKDTKVTTEPTTTPYYI